MKTRIILLTFALTALFTRCGSDEFDDTDLLLNVSGVWKISYPYIGFKEDNGDLVIDISSSYPYLNYEMSITTDGQVILYTRDEDVPTVITLGKVKGVSKNRLAFDQALSQKLNEIGNFEIENPSKAYRILPGENDSYLEINYSFKSSVGDSQYEGFLLERVTL